MIFNVFTLFPDMIDSLVRHSIIKRAIDSGKIVVNSIDIRKFSDNKHGSVDDYPYGGGAGMVMMPGPVVSAFKNTVRLTDELIYMSPKGKVLNQKKVIDLSGKEEINILCGHYEGIDQRAIDMVVTEEISVGDYVLTGGEIPAMILIDSVARLVDGVIREDSLSEESHTNGLLEYPQYTRPYEYEGMVVPDVLISGHHENINKYRRFEAIKETFNKRRDLLDLETLTDEEKAFVNKLSDGPLT